MFEHVTWTLAQAAEGGNGAPTDVPPVVREGQTSQGQSATEGQALPGADGTTQQAPPPGGPFSNFGFIFFLLIIVLFWFILMGGQRKEKKRRRELLEAIKKGDRVQSIGGILGTVVEVRDTEVIVKVDENANTRLRFAKSAIQSILEDKAD